MEVREEATRATTDRRSVRSAEAMRRVRGALTGRPGRWEAQARDSVEMGRRKYSGRRLR